MVQLPHTCAMCVSEGDRPSLGKIREISHIATMRIAARELVRLGPFPPDEAFARVGDRTLRICRATVRVANAAFRLAIYWPEDDRASPPSVEALADELRREPGGTLGAVVRASGEGSMDLATTHTDAGEVFAIAAAAAAARLSCAWDDCPTIAVIVNDAHFAIAPHYTGTHWEAVEILVDAA